ncbi:MAG: hypothetical protein ABIA63_03480 [bacterium]
MKMTDQEISLNSRQVTESRRIRITNKRFQSGLPIGNQTAVYPLQKVPRDFHSVFNDRIQATGNDYQDLNKSLNMSAQEFKVMIIRQIILAFANTGNKSGYSCTNGNLGKTGGINQHAQNPDNARHGFIKITAYESSFIRNTVEINSEGVVTTEDGRKISFTAMLKMSHEEYRELFSQEYAEYEPDSALSGTTVSVEESYLEAFREARAANMVDPLVLNLDGRAAALSDRKACFDLDGDGKKDLISELAKGSFFLAFDRNQNGRIDDGKELFGPETGNGFAELARYNEDSNMWIDENDPIFKKLCLWRPGDEAGQSLLDMDVGAIYLNIVGGQVALGIGGDSIQGQLREHGIWLRESNGAPGFIHEMDLKK